MTVQQAKMLDLASTWKAKSVLVRFCFHPERDPTRGQWSICVGANDDSHITYWDESDVADPERLERNTANTVAAWRQQEGNNPPLRMVCAVCAREIGCRASCSR